MKRILLAIEDFSDQNAFQYLLKRIGFDCAVVTRDASLSETLLSFYPDLVILGAMGRNIDIRRVEPKLIRLQPIPKIAVLSRKNRDQKNIYQSIPEDRMDSFDALVELPVPPVGFLRIVCQMLNIQENTILEKFEKLNQAQKQDPTMVAVFSGVERDAKVEPSTSERESRYQKFLNTHPIEEDAKVLPRSEARRAMQELADAASPEKSDLEDLMEKKRQFVKNLFLK